MINKDSSAVCRECGLAYSVDPARPHMCAEWARGKDKNLGEMKSKNPSVVASGNSAEADAVAGESPQRNWDETEWQFMAALAALDYMNFDTDLESVKDDAAEIAGLILEWQATSTHTPAVSPSQQWQEWSDEFPLADGWYWMRGFQQYRPLPVEIENGSLSMMFGMGHYSQRDVKGAEFSPLPLPLPAAPEATQQSSAASYTVKVG